jgi:two-component system, NtrC family, nitrogen regulation sensor histidine kinase NtrY
VNIAPRSPNALWNMEERHTGPGWFGGVAVVAALVSALVTFLVLAGMTPLLPTHDVVVWVLLINLVIVVLLIGIVAWEARALIRARRRGAAAARLHVRIVGLFSLMATLPTILVAVAATFTLERGLDPWFTGSIRSLLTNTVDIARTYRDAQCQSLGRETNLMAVDLNRARVMFDADRKVFQDFMRSRAFSLGFPSAMIFEASGQLVERVELKPIAELPMPSAQDLKEASDSEPLCLFSKNSNLYRALVKLNAHNDKVLYVARYVDPRAVEFAQGAEAGFAYYQALEQKKFGIQVAFASMFALVAFLVLLSAVWFGLSFANRFVAPIRRLIHATDQVGSGNFYVQVPVKHSEGDLAHLSETFNTMTQELRHQHDGLVAATDVMDQRRRFIEAVLNSVPAAVVGINREGVIGVVNPSAESLLGQSHIALQGQKLETIIADIAPLLLEASSSRQRQARGQITFLKGGQERILNVRIAGEQAGEYKGEHGGEEPKSFVVALDDITDLVGAQRTSAWADVARRIAHEIKNPLTPIQLSAERIRRKYGKVIIEDRAIFDQCTDTIIRQVDDIKRMVDEFSSFARMPKPTLLEEDVIEPLRHAAFMMRVAHPDIEFIDQLSHKPVIALFDRRLISQGVTNIIKNAAEAVEAVPEHERGQGRIVLASKQEDTMIVIDVIDNGKGFPVENRQRLLEPYMTTREGGTGLGLAIVGKIFEDHGGGIELLDNPAGRGACVRIRLPLNISSDRPAVAREHTFFHTPSNPSSNIQKVSS